MHKILSLLPDNTQKLLQSYPYHRAFAVRCNATTSNQSNIETGVPQEGAMGPTL